MRINRAYRYEMAPTGAQRLLLARHAGTARFAYNWGLAERLRLYRENDGKDRFTDAIRQHRELNRLKKTEFSWMYEVSKCAPQEALRDLQRAFDNFLRGRKTGERIGFPRFKKKGKKRDGFRLTGTIKAWGKHAQLPRVGVIRLKERAAVRGKILSATVSRAADRRWFVSFTVETDLPDPVTPSGVPIGVDLGILHLATLSDGTVVENPRPLARKLRKVQKLSRSLNRRKPGSGRRRKARDALARAHWKVANLRVDTLHKLTTVLVRNHSEIVIEDLNVRGMVKNRRLARAVSDAGFGMFRQMLEYKSDWYGATLEIAPRFFPSSKRCSHCGMVRDELPLSERTFRCPSCGLEIDRDLNAARNLVARSWRETLNARGDAVSLSTGEQGSMRRESEILRELS